MIDRGKRNTTLNEAKPVKGICNNCNGFQKTRYMQKEILSQHIQQDNKYK